VVIIGRYQDLLLVAAETIGDQIEVTAMTANAEEVLRLLRQACVQFRQDREKADDKYGRAGANSRLAEFVGMVSALDYLLTHGISPLPVTWTRTKVIVNGFISKCGHCGGNANHEERRHYHGGPGDFMAPDSSLDHTNGCGAIFESILHVEILPG
jgi:hypothetical protein